MFDTLAEKVLAALLSVVLVLGLGLAVYAGFEHNVAQNARISELQQTASQAQANEAAAVQAASALGAALDAKAAAQQTAAQNHTAATGRVASAVAADPAVASTVVPESYWQAIYGTPNAK